MHLPSLPAVPDLAPRTLERVRRLIFNAAGIALGSDKTSMVRARLSKRLAATGFTDFDSYLDFVEGRAEAAERHQLISALTTNVTHFFREPHHFEKLRELADSTFSSGRSMNIWSAGCSSGQEPYSIAMTLANSGFRENNAHILATDIDREILKKATAARYSARDLETICTDFRNRWTKADCDRHIIAQELRAMVEFRALNLTGLWPFRDDFDVIFCRNVAIYFDQPTQDRLWSRMINLLRAGGWLFIGHSERIPDSLLGQVRYCGQTTYQNRK